jgi:hypothetical protein
MPQYLDLLIWCVVVITGIAVYVPIMYIRKTNKMLKTLEQIEANTRKPQA